MKLPMWARVVAVVLLTCGAALLILPLADGRIGELGGPVELAVRLKLPRVR